MLHNPRFDRRSIATAVAVPAPPFPTRLGRRIAWRKPVLVTAAVLAALLAIIVGLIAVAASRSFELPFIRVQIAGMVESTLGPGYDVTVGSAVLDTDPVLGLVLRLGDIRVTDAMSADVLRVRSSLLAIDPAAIVTPRAVLRSVEIDGLWVSLARDGRSIRLGNLQTPAISVAEPAIAAAPAAGLDALAEPVEALDRSLAEVLAFARRSGFERIGLYDAEIDLWRVGSDVPQHFARAEVSFEADPVAGRLSASLTASGYSGRWSVTADRSVAPNTGNRTLSLAFSQLTMADFFGPGASSNIPFYGQGTIRLGDDGAVAGGHGILHLGAGSFALGPDSVPIGLDQAAVNLRWDVPQERIVIEPSRFSFGPSRIVLAGTIGTAAGGGLAFDIGSVDAVLAPRDSPSPPLPVDSLRLRGSADFDTRLIAIDEFSIETPFGSFNAAGSIGLEPLSPSIALAATFSEMPVWALKQLWPAGFQDGGRRWLIDNMLDGRITGGEVTASIPAGVLASGAPIPADMLRVQLSLADVTFRTMEGMPNVTGANGVAVLSGSSLGIDIEEGQIVAPGGGVVEITAAAFAIPETATAVPMARLEATAVGPASAFGAIADSPPLNALQPFDMPAGALHGDGAARMSATWPLVEGMSKDEIQWRIVMDLTDLSADRPLQGRTVANGNVNLDITPSVVLVTGQATVDGLPANVDFAFPLLPDVDGRQQIRLVLDEAGRERLGFNLEEFVGGTVLAQVTDLAPAEIGQHYEIDLGPARVSLAPLGWTKGVDVPATLSFDMIKVPTGYQVRNLRLVGEGFGLSGEADLDENYGLIRAAITDFGIRRDDDVDVVLTRDGNSWRATLNGSSLDLRGLIAEGIDGLDDLGGDGGGTAPDVRVSGHFGRLIGFNGEVIVDASIQYESTDGELRQIEISGTLNGQPISLVYSRPGIVTGVEGYIGDAGAALRFMNYYSHIDGGVIRVNGLEYSDGAIRGNVELSNFHIVDEPGLARLMMPPEGETAEPADAVPFERLAFSYMQLESRITVDDIVLRGGQMGATGAGWVDFGDGTLNIAGTYIPAYEVNNLFGRIPVLGIALGGGAQEGLFGITFRVFGEVAQPQMEVNPLSVIAPGIFRKIFQFQ